MLKKAFSTLSKSCAPVRKRSFVTGPSVHTTYGYDVTLGEKLSRVVVETQKREWLEDQDRQDLPCHKFEQIKDKEDVKVVRLQA
jgi:hypothetical protein